MNNLVKALGLSAIIAATAMVPAMASEVGVNNTYTTNVTTGCVHNTSSGYENYNGTRYDFSYSSKTDKGGSISLTGALQNNGLQGTLSFDKTHEKDVAGSIQKTNFSGHTQFSNDFNGTSTTTSFSHSSSAFTTFGNL